MDGEQGDSTVPPAARAFLERHRPAQDNLGSARRDADHEDRNNDDGEDDNAAGDQRGDNGELEVHGHRVGGSHDVAEDAEPGVSAPPIPEKNIFLAPRPRAKGVSHPSVPTRAQVDRHALEQHVNYATWCPHCVQASALMRKHPLVAGDSPSVPSISADFCFMKGREADSGDGIPVLVMRDSQTRSLFSHACAGKSTSREGHSGHLIGRCVEDIDSVQKDVHFKTDQEPAMLALQVRIQQARRSRTTPTKSPKGDHQANGRPEKGSLPEYGSTYEAGS